MEQENIDYPCNTMNTEKIKLISKRKAKKLLKHQEYQEKKQLLKQSGEWKKRKRKNERNWQQAKRDNFSIVTPESVTVTYKNGQRFIKPYLHTFQVYAKDRWCGKSIIEVFLSEFSGYSREYYNNSIKQGRILINGLSVQEKTIIKGGDLIQHQVHRHEPPVWMTSHPDFNLVVHQSEEMVVVNKPSTLPVHACGPYRHNSLQFLLGRENKLVNLYTIHRLDRLTSGVVLLAKTTEKAREVSQLIQQGQVRKVYLAKVQGRFPCASTTNTSEGPDGTIYLCQRVHQNENTWWKVQVAIQSCVFDDTKKRKLADGNNKINGKASETLFRVQRYYEEDDTSLVICEPKTGRTHQIRLHLQYLGFPIANDPLYNPNYSTPSKQRQDMEVCTECHLDPLKFFSHEQLNHSGIFLHALEYQGPNWKFNVPVPDWALTKN